MDQQSIWVASAVQPAANPLLENINVDVCVVGAGIAGLTTAYLLAKEGKRVAVLDDGPVGSGMTGRTSAHLSYALDAFYFELEKTRGGEAAHLAAQSHRAAIERIDEIVRQEHIDCEFSRVDGYLFLAKGDKPATLERELAAAHRAGLLQVTNLDRAPYASFDSGPCLCFPDCGQFHPLKYLKGLADAIQRSGGAIFTGSHVRDIEDGMPIRISAGTYEVTARFLVVATNSPVNDVLSIHTKQAPYMTYVLAARVPRGSVPAILAWDTGDPYHYVRVARMAEEDVLIVGGEDHKSGQADDQERRYANLDTWMRARFAMAGDIVYRWGGQVMETIDYLAFSGRNPGGNDNVFVHTGDSGMGLTHGTIGGILISDQICGRTNPWTELYDPARKPVRAAANYLAENLNVVRQYAKHLTPGVVHSRDGIAHGTGAVMRSGVHMLAIYRDDAGAVHERSAICPHLGCLVQWNVTEKTWDCPCHGSRFDALGGVVNGPANKDLAIVARPHPNNT
jgi:glycine/D-amino acid oxidase-like deaminating enzyme/nitrite reductase/ring-hydroxylating ferredoxin subunit